MGDLFFEIGSIIVLVALLSFVLTRFRQPLILAYVLAGVLAGPSVLHLVRSPEVFETFSTFGVSFLLFSVGLGLNWQRVKEVGAPSVLLGIGQVLATILIVFGVSTLLGFDAISSAYLGAAFAFSSTIIGIKFLSDKDELDTLYGRMSVGFLLMQDFIAMFFLLFLRAWGSGEGLVDILLGTGGKVLLLIPIMWLCSQYLIPRVLSAAARSQELLFLVAIAWCFFCSWGLNFLGFGGEIGALVAGISLASTVYVADIASRLRPIRDFFLMVFFILLGTHITLEALTALWKPMFIYAGYVLIGFPLLAISLTRLLGYHTKTGWLVGTTLAQTSEFSFILVGLGVSLGHIDPLLSVLVTGVGMITIVGSSYLMTYHERLYRIFRPFLLLLFPAPHTRHHLPRPSAPEIYLLGFHGVGQELLDAVRALGRPYVVVDFDAHVIQSLAAKGEPVLYGDVADEEFLSEIRLNKAKLILSTVPNQHVSLGVLAHIRERGYKGSMIVSVHETHEADACYLAGADYVIVPKRLGGEKMKEHLLRSKLAARSWRSLGRQARITPTA
jgi:Kef-type K+ transport system membrane component KefB